jgi:hypothetical protein
MNVAAFKWPRSRHARNPISEKNRFPLGGREGEIGVLRCPHLLLSARTVAAWLHRPQAGTDMLSEGPRFLAEAPAGAGEAASYPIFFFCALFLL